MAKELICAGLADKMPGALIKIRQALLADYFGKF